MKRFSGKRLWGALVFLALGAGLAACSTQPPMPTVAKVDLPRFMGPWYVIGVIPTFIEKDIYNAIETYALAPDGTIKTTFTFNQGSFDGELKRYQPTGFVVPNTGNAVWGMQFVWPIKAEYRIVYLDEGYQTTIIARNARDYVWLMSRQASMSDQAYQGYVAQIQTMGYDVSKLVRIPHQLKK